MRIIEIESYFWELYEDSEIIYLNVIININAIKNYTFERGLVLKNSCRIYNK